jgi:hypothetical protein
VINGNSEIEVTVLVVPNSGARGAEFDSQGTCV